MFDGYEHGVHRSTLGIQYTGDTPFSDIAMEAMDHLYYSKVFLYKITRFAIAIAMLNYQKILMCSIYSVSGFQPWLLTWVALANMLCFDDS